VSPRCKDDESHAQRGIANLAGINSTQQEMKTMPELLHRQIMK
jgi:hypothetical protein